VAKALEVTLVMLSVHGRAWFCPVRSANAAAVPFLTSFGRFPNTGDRRKTFREVAVTWARRMARASFARRAILPWSTGPCPEQTASATVAANRGPNIASRTGASATVKVRFPPKAMEPA